ncbi:restriction endonuclease [Streptomyces sp. TRM 70361]|uniref:restriction endonuclease n=1 Tax=Streptomyces sp. TRM 70361 TaxID=3116553 RepID=UPI002E7BF822|nr:restriction endonuclease [Streptomyces sp. TRM 70361]MEE1939559.1 restriction endonuclease [Streptomyces sp. TRM 70361]
MLNESVLLESRSLRESVVDRTEALDKVKVLSVLPDGFHVTTQMVADYFEVGLKAVTSLVVDNREELESNGYRVLTGTELNSFKEFCQVQSRTRSQAVFSRRTVLNVAMLLRDSIVARQVRAYLLDAERGNNPQPVDNLVRVHADIDLAALDERITRISAETTGRIIGRTVVPMLNHLIDAFGEQRRELAGIREDLDDVRRTLRGRRPVAAAAALDAMDRREFTDQVAGLCRRDGCTVLGADGDSDSRLGADLVGHTAGGRRLAVRYERPAPHRAVGGEEMRKFAEAAKARYGAEVRLSVTTSAFTPAALELAGRHGITTVHRELLEAWSAGATLRVLR